MYKIGPFGFSKIPIYYIQLYYKQSYSIDLYLDHFRSFLESPQLQIQILYAFLKVIKNMYEREL